MQTTEQIVPDHEIISQHGTANFGKLTPRQVVDEGVMKAAFGFSHGNTQYHILRGHKLITTKGTLTKKGFFYARALYNAGTALN